MKATLKRSISLLLSLIMVFSMVGGSIVPLAAGNVLYYYYDAGGVERYQFADFCEVLTDDMTALAGNEYGKWYVTGYISPKGFAGTPAIEHSLTVTGKVNLLLRDGYSVWVEGGIYVTAGSTLTIYGHDTGKLICKATDDAAGIGGKKDAVGGNVVINSGYIEAHGEDGAGIGGGYDENSGFQTVTINGGTVIATGDCGGAGIGDGQKNKKSGGSVITINGGSVTATGGDGGMSDGGAAGIGGGKSSDHKGASVIINGGVVNATGGDDAAGIGGGENSRDWRSITINGGTVNATGGDGGAQVGGGGAGIGGGQNRGNGVIRINGGTVVAKAGGLDQEQEEHGAGIGGGADGSQDNPIYISGGDVKAYGGLEGAGIGGGGGGAGNDVYISGGTVYAKAGSWADGIGGGRCTEETSPWNPVVQIPPPGNVYISGGVVTAVTTSHPTETENGAGIGCWAGKTNGTEVVITGGVVFAHATGLGAGIGGSRTKGCSGGRISISNAYVVATSVSGAGIGSQGSWEDDSIIGGETVEINNSYVFASSSKKGAGIGGGNDGDGCPVIIKDSVVEAFGGNVDYDWYAEHGAVSARGVEIKMDGAGSGYAVSAPVTGMIMSAVITALNQLTRSGSYRGAGIGGGDEGKGGDVTIENSSVLAVGGGDKAHAFGHGHDTDGSNGTLTLSDDLMVSAGRDEASMTVIRADARTQAAWDQYYVKIEPCAHAGATFTGMPDGHFVSSCPNCTAAYDENDLAAHAFGEDQLCSVCGYQGVQVTYSSGNFEGYMAPVVIGRGATLTLPEAGDFNCGQYGYLQSGWLIDGTVHPFGDRVVLSRDTTVTAVYDIAYDVFIIDSEGGKVIADRNFVLSGTPIHLTATADKGYSLTGIRVRADGNTIYEKNGEQLAASHSFPMPSANAAVYSVFTKNIYNITADEAGFGVNIVLSANTASVGDRITVSVPKVNGVEGIVITETASGAKHDVPLNAAGQGSFLFDFESDIIITPGGLHAHDGIVFLPWGAAAEEKTHLPASGRYYLVSDIALNEAYAPKNEVYLCLNGHTITASDIFEDSHLFELAATHLHIYDHDDSGVIDAQGDRGIVYLYNSRLTLCGGTLTGGSAATGSVIDTECTNDYEKYAGFTMHGGVITGNTGTAQGVISMFGAPMHIDGGTITGNTAPTAITVQRNGPFVLSGDPVITGNVPAGHSYQCNVLLAGGKIDIEGQLSDAARIGVTANGTIGAGGHIPVTNGLSGNGTIENFISDDDTRAIGLFDSEAALGVPVTICFDKNGGSGADMDDVRVANGSQYRLPACLFTPPAGVFAGWKIGESDVIRQENETITASGDMTLHAVWEDSGSETAFIEPHIHRWEIKTDETDPSRATVRCVNAVSECNESDARWAQLTVEGRPGAYTKVYDGNAVTARVAVQTASQYERAFFDGSLITVGSVSYYDEAGNRLTGAPVDAGVYTAMATVSPANGRGLPGTLRQTITVAKAAAPEITVSGVDLTPQAAAQPMAEVSGSTDDGTIYTRLNGGSWMPGICTAKDPGEYTVDWYFEGRNCGNVNSREHPGTVQSSISDVHSHDGLDFVRWTGTDSLPTQPGNYYLTDNVNLTSDWTPGGDIHLCLFGKTVNLNENYFVIRDCSVSLFGDGEGTVTGAGGVFVGRTARLDSHGVIYDRITNNFTHSKFDGMGAALMISGVFQMDGGRLVNSHGYAGGLQLGYDSHFSVTGGPVIRNNTGNGGKTKNVYLADSSNLVYIEDGLTGYASIGLYANAFNGGDEEYVLTDHFASHCPGLLPAEVFSLDNALDSTYAIDLSDAGNAVIRHHVHAFELKLSDGRTDMAEFRCLNEDGCPLHGQVVTAQVFAADAVYDGEEHGGYLQVLIDGKPAESSYGGEVVIDLGGRKHLEFTDVMYYDKYNTRVDRFYKDENGNIVWVDCAPYEEGTYTAKAWLIYNDYADNTEERVEISVPITIHSHRAAEAVIENEIAGTCQSPAAYDEVVYCSVCGEEMRRETKTGAFGAHVEAIIPGIAADCTHTGLTDGVKCSVCGSLLQAQTIIEKTEHLPGEAVIENEVAATAETEGGYDTVVCCAVCGEELSRVHTVIEKLTPAPADPITVVAHSLSLNGDIGVNFYVDIPAVTQAAYAEFTVDGKTVTAPVDLTNYTVLDGKTLYKFTCSVAAAQIDTEITGAIYNGDQVSEPISYSVHAYLTEAQQTMRDDTAFMALAGSLATYGYYANILNDHNPDFTQHALFDNAPMAAVTAASLADAAAQIENTEAGVVYYGSSLVLRTKTAIRHYFTVPEGKAIEDFTFICEGLTLTPVANGSYYYVEIPDIASAKLGTAYTVTVTDANGSTVNVWTYSAMSYAYKALSKEDADAALTDAVKALAVYYGAAKQYFGA